MASASNQKKTQCTDVLFLVVFLVFLAGLGTIWGIGVQRGDARRLVYPMDYEGNLCGVNNKGAGGRDMRHKDFLAWFDKTDYSSQICVVECTTEAAENNIVLPSHFTSSEIYGDKGDDVADDQFPRYDDMEVLGRCLPRDMSTADEEFKSFLAGSSGIHLFNDIERGYWLLLIAFAITVLLCIFHLYFLRVCAAEMVWVTVLIAILLIGGFAVLAIMAGCGVDSMLTRGISDKFGVAITHEAQLQLLVFGILFAVLDFCLIVLVGFFAKKINLVGAMMEEAGQVLTQMPSIVVFPMVPLIMALAFFVIWMVFTLFLLSAHSLDLNKDPVSQLTQTRVGEMDSTLQFGLVYDLIALVWVTFYLLALTKVTIARGVQTWYFARDKSKIPPHVLRDTFLTTLAYQTGSLALGSFLITSTLIIKWVTRAVAYVLAKRRQTPYVRFFIVCVLCVVELFLRLVNLFSHFAYIHMAISDHSVGFCESARVMGGLISRHTTKIQLVDVVGDLVLFLCKLNVTFLTGYVMTLLVGSGPVQSQVVLFQPQAMVFLAMLIAYPIASCFFGIFEMGIDTTLVCFCMEVDNDESEFMSPRLREFIERHENLLLEKRAQEMESAKTDKKGKVPS